MTGTRGPSRHILSSDIHGETLHSEAQYIANAADVGSMGQGMATSGLAVSGDYVEITAGLAIRKSVAVYNDGADTVFLGPSGNGIANMYPVAGSGGQISFNVTSGVAVYGVTDGTATNIRVMEIG
jgi:hypothetical protein